MPDSPFPLIDRNPFRWLGVYAGSTTRDIVAQQSRLKALVGNDDLAFPDNDSLIHPDFDMPVNAPQPSNTPNP